MEREAKQTHELIADALLEHEVDLEDTLRCCQVAIDSGFGRALPSDVWRARDLAKRICQSAQATRMERL